MSLLPTHTTSTEFSGSERKEYESAILLLICETFSPLKTKTDKVWSKTANAITNASTFNTCGINFFTFSFVIVKSQCNSSRNQACTTRIESFLTCFLFVVFPKTTKETTQKRSLPDLNYLDLSCFILFSFLNSATSLSQCSASSASSLRLSIP